MNSSLSPESEFRYIIQWFRDFSEYEKSDFQEILLKWLLNKNEAPQVNGINENCSTKPTIFACRVSRAYIYCSYNFIFIHIYSCR